MLDDTKGGMIMSLWSSLTKGLNSTFKGVTDIFSGKNPFSSGGGFNSLLKGAAGDVQYFAEGYTGERMAKKNLEAQEAQWKKQNDLNERQFAYQKQLNELQMQREDTAYQRKVADMTAAGFNPILATGGSGSPSASLSAPSLKAPSAPVLDDYSSGIRGAVDQVLSLIGMKKEFAMKDQQIQLMKDQGAASKAQEEYYRSMAGKASSETVGIDIDNQYRADRNLNENAGIRLRNIGQASANVSAGYRNSLLENDMFIALSTRSYDIEKKMLSVSRYKKDILLADADLLLKSDEHFLKQYESNLLAVKSEFARKFADKELDKNTYEMAAKAVTLAKMEADLKLYQDAKRYYERLGYSPAKVRQKLDYQFGSWSAQFDKFSDLISSAGVTAKEFLRSVDIDYWFLMP